jgi:hypothetical protein
MRSVCLLLLFMCFADLPMRADGMPNAPRPAARTGSPDAVAQRLYRAWTRGDRRAALQVATPRVVRSLFRTSGRGGAGWQFQGCERVGSGYRCAFSYEGGATTMTVRRMRAGYRVVGIRYIAD